MDLNFDDVRVGIMHRGQLNTKHKNNNSGKDTIQQLHADEVSVFYFGDDCNIAMMIQLYSSPV